MKRIFILKDIPKLIYLQPNETRLNEVAITAHRKKISTINKLSLINNRPLWDIVMILLLLGGTTVSLTATGLGIKFILRKRRGFLKRRSRRR